MEEGWRRGGRRVKVGLRELEGRKLGQGGPGEDYFCN